MMNDDIKKYPVYGLCQEGLVKIELDSTDDYNHFTHHLHHFIRQEVRKNSPDFYKRVENLQKLILMPSAVNYDLETMGEDKFFKKWKFNKNDLVFSRLKWREGYYDSI